MNLHIYMVSIPISGPCAHHNNLLISGFGRGANKICALLESYAACVGKSVPTFRDNLPNPIFILIINHFDAQNLFYNKFISCLYMFRASCAHRQEVKIVLYSLWYHHIL